MHIFYLVAVCAPGSWVTKNFLTSHKLRISGKKLFLANFFRVFVKTPHGWIFALSILEKKDSQIDIARTRVIVLYSKRNL